jgi:hypothetical protein
MANALDAFRAQKEAADQVHARLTEVAALLNRLRIEVDGLVTTELREALREEQSLLSRAQETMAVARHFREQEMLRFWPSIWRRWAIAIVFALSALAVAGGAYGWATTPPARELAELRERANFGDRVLMGLARMNAMQRRQFEALLRESGPVGERR